ncbi:conserved hypothetical protein, partial [Trichinella spiralis]|uniref:hypothetical protein n=1 Tax=Trichinella spiralis TaxID=6334 RepID=UPI0001EFD4C4
NHEHDAAVIADVMPIFTFDSDRRCHIRSKPSSTNLQSLHIAHYTALCPNQCSQSTLKVRIFNFTANSISKFFPPTTTTTTTITTDSTDEGKAQTSSSCHQDCTVDNNEISSLVGECEKLNLLNLKLLPTGCGGSYKMELTYDAGRFNRRPRVQSFGMFDASTERLIQNYYKTDVGTEPNDKQTG